MREGAVRGADGLNLDREPVFAPVLGVVEHLGLVTLAEGGPAAHEGDGGGVGLGALEKVAGLAAHDLGKLVAGHPGEARVDPLDEAESVRDDHGVIGAGRDKRQLLRLGLGEL